MRYGIFLAATAFAVFIFASQPNADAQDAVKVINLEKLNTDADEEDPCPTPDGNTLLYATNAKGKYAIYKSSKTEKTAFSAGKPFIFDKVTDFRCPILWKDKYFFVTNEVPDKKFEKLKNFDIKMQIGFQASNYLGAGTNVNTKDDEMYPWITPSGKEFYFSRKTEDGWKLFVAEGPAPGPIGKPKAVGFAAGFHRATVAGTGLTMYLQGPLDDGKIGIFRSKRAKTTDKWGEPAAVTALNHAESKKGDMQPALNADGSRLYFVSDRPGGKGGLDIWYVATVQLK